MRFDAGPPFHGQASAGVGPPVAEPVGIARAVRHRFRRGDDPRHHGWPASARLANRVPSGGLRSMRATASAGIRHSAVSRQAKTTKVDKGAERAETRHPPDVPDQREAGDVGEEGADEAGRAVARHLDVARSRAARASRVCSRARCFMPQ